MLGGIGLGDLGVQIEIRDTDVETRLQFSTNDHVLTSESSIADMLCVAMSNDANKINGIFNDLG